MVQVFPRWLKIVLIIIGIGLIAGAIILLVDTEPKLDMPQDEPVEILAAKTQTINQIKC